MAIPSRPDAKNALRKELRAVLRATDESARAQWSIRITGVLAAWLEERPALRSVAVFAPLPGEPDLRGLHELLPGRDFLYPLVDPTGGLSFRRVQDPATLVPGQFSIPEPDPLIHPAVAPAGIDAVLCPGLAFAADGARLGRGKGYYDQALATLDPQTPRVAVGFGIQMRPIIPVEPHDILMTHLADESGVRGVRTASAP